MAQQMVGGCELFLTGVVRDMSVTGQLVDFLKQKSDPPLVELQETEVVLSAPPAAPGGAPGIGVKSEESAAAAGSSGDAKSETYPATISILSKPGSEKSFIYHKSFDWSVSDTSVNIRNISYSLGG